MNFTKKALAVSVAAVAMSSAQAGTWAPDTSEPVFATELFGSANTTVISPTAAVYTMASGISGATVVDYTLTGGTWGAALTAASLTYTANNAGTTTISLVAGGTTTDSTAQFRLAQAIAGAADDTLSLAYTIGNVTGLSAASTTSGPTLAFSVTDVLGAVDTAGAATVVASSADLATIAAATGGTDSIDVTNGSSVFTDGTTTATAFDLGDLTVTVATARDSDNSENGALNTNEFAVEGGEITITGDFAAALAYSVSDTLGDATTTTNDGVQIDASSCLGTSAINATTLTGSTATFTLTAANVGTIGAAGAACTFTMNVDGTTAIGESTYTGGFTVDYTTAGLADEAFSGAMTTTAKNGSNVVVPLLLNPDGAYDNFVRITNGGTIAGKVFVTLTNDSGDSATGTLLDGANLAAGNSADLISVATLVAAAQAADATFTVGTGKLRATIEGEFAGIAVQNISVSTDGTTFFTF